VGADVRLTPLEWSFFSYLADQQGTSVDREELLVEVWGYHPLARTRAIDNTVARLRKKLEVRPDQPKHLLSVRGGGYRLVCSVVGVATEGAAWSHGIDRPDAMSALADAVSRSRLSTLTGAGGSGKTWLAMSFSRHCSSSYAGGIVHCSLEDCGDLAAVEAHVADALGEPPARVAMALSDRGELVLVLDDAERAVDALAQLLPGWLQAAPRLRILLTSRAPLKLLGERRVALAQLSLDAAVALFIQRAEQVGGTAVDSPALRALVEQLDRLPLAIELAAALTQTLTTAQLTDELKDRFRLLRARGRERAERHRAMRTVIEQSVAQLPSWQQDALLQCAVFRGGFTAEDVESVIDVGDHWPVDALHTLQEAHLARVERGADGSRIWLYRSVKAWVREELAKNEAMGEAVRRRHAVWFARAGRIEALRDLAGSPQRQRVLCQGRENLQAALSWAVEAGEGELVAPLVLGMLEVIARLGPKTSAIPLARRTQDIDLSQQELDRIVIRALEIGSSLLPQPELELETREILARVASTGDTWALAAGTLVLGHILGRLGRFEAGAETLALARSQCAAIGDRYREAEALCYLAVMRRIGSRWDEALVFFQEALAIQKALDDRVGEAITRSELGALWTYRGRPRHALEHFEIALQMFRIQGERKREAVTRIHVAGSHEALGAVDEAREALRSAKVIATELGEVDMLVDIEVHLAAVDVCGGQFAEPEAVYLAAEQAYREQGNVFQEAITRGNRGALYLSQGAVERAHACLESAFESLVPLASPAAVGTFQGALAMTTALRGEVETAAAMAEEAWERLEGTRPAEVAVLACRRGQIALMGGDVASAEAFLAHATQLGEQMGVGTASPVGEAVAKLVEALSAGKKHHA